MVSQTPRHTPGRGPRDLDNHYSRQAFSSMHVTTPTMTRSTTPPAATTASNAVAREVIDRLQGILSHVDGFLADWLERYEAAAEPAPAITAPSMTDTAAVPAPPNTAPDSVLARRIAQFESDKRHWQAQRDSETERLNEKFQQLTEGWLHLETERRALLQAQQTQRSRRPPAAAEVTETVVNRPNVAVPAANPLPQAVANKGVGSEVFGGDAVQQFQQLRRQIDSSRQPRDQP